MERLLALVLSVVISFALLTTDKAHAAHGHYASGAEGLKVATLPPPGFYYLVYNCYYSASTRKNQYGKSGENFSADVFTMAHRFAYSTDIEFLGGSLFFDTVIPIAYADITVGGGGPSDSKFGLGDVLLEALVTWHTDRWDVTLGPAVYLPIGYYDHNNPASPGKGFWTGMFNLGATYYFDEARSWHASSVGRYEIHSKQQTTHVTPGHDFHFEWGVGKTFPSEYQFQLGAIGYCAWQINEDTGSRSVDGRQRAFAVGPEVGFALPALGMGVSLRSVWEFENRNDSQGNLTSLVLMKAF